MNGSSRPRWAPFGAVLVSCVAVTAGMVLLRPSLRLATVALVYLLVVFLSAVRWGRGPSLTASLLSFLALNFFFTVPYGTSLHQNTTVIYKMALQQIPMVAVTDVSYPLRPRAPAPVVDLVPGTEDTPAPVDRLPPKPSAAAPTV